MSFTRTLVLTGIISVHTALLGGCAAVVGAGVATGASVAYDRRTAGTMLDDQNIELKAVGALQSDEELWRHSHINVVSFNNIVLLTGETPSEALRQRAAEHVRQLPKVRKVHNEIKIAAPSSMLSRSGDSWITGKVKASLLNQLALDVNRVKVVTENGVVFLMGLVTQAEAEKATEIARQVKGVQRVVRIFEYVDT